MPDTESEAAELACLHKQVTERVACLHSPRHVELGEAIIRGIRTEDPITQRAIRAATRPRFAAGSRLYRYTR